MAPRERQQELYEQSLCATLTLDGSGYVVASNAAAAKLLGTSAASLRSAPLLKHMHAGDREAVRELLAAAKLGEQRDARVRLAAGAGACEAELRLVPHPPPCPPGTTLVFLQPDPAQRERVADASQIATVLERLPGQLVLVLDQHGAVRQSRGASAAIWQKDEEVRGRRFAWLLDPSESPASIADAVWREVAAGREWTGTLWFRRSDESSLAMRVFLSPVRRDDGIAGAIVVAHDRNDEQELRRRLGRAERLARIGELVASIASELRQPLDALELYAGARCANGGGEGDRASWQHVRAVSRRLAGLLEGLLAFSSEVKLERSAAAVGDVIRAAIGALGPKLRDASIQIVQQVPESLTPIHIDTTQVQHVIEHVLANAAEAVAGSTPAVIRIEASQKDGTLLLRFHDTGPGIPGEHLDRVFDPFFTTRRGRPGLGLSIARCIVAAHEGRIWVDLPPGGGTAVFVELPAQPDVVANTFRPVPIAAARTGRVLVIDDDKALRATLRKFLARVGYDVDEAWSGRSALARIMSAQRPEMVVTDLKMKDGTGYWLLEEMRRDFPELLKRTVIMTGDPSRTAMENLSQEMGCPVVNKPFELTSLMDAMDEVAMR